MRFKPGIVNVQIEKKELNVLIIINNAKIDKSHKKILNY